MKFRKENAVPSLSWSSSTNLKYLKKLHDPECIDFAQKEKCQSKNKITKKCLQVPNSWYLEFKPFQLYEDSFVFSPKVSIVKVHLQRSLLKSTNLTSLNGEKRARVLKVTVAAEPMVQ